MNNQSTLITPREAEVLHLIAHEHSSKEIARKLYVSYETVSTHRKNMMDKLGVRNTAGLVRVAFERGLMRGGQVACLLIISFILTGEVGAQVLNENINYQVRSVAYSISNDDDNGDEEILFEFNVVDDNDGAATDVNNQNKECIFFSGDCENRCYHTETKNLLTKINSSSKAFDLTMESWETDGDEDCSNASNSTAYNRNWWRRTLRNNPSGQWNQEAFNQDNSAIADVQTVWRYNLGNNWANVLDFGTINSGSKGHNNSNRKAPSGANPNMGYTDAYNTNYTNGQPSADVHYIFKIDDAKRVRITTSHSYTTFDTYIHLLKYNSATSTSYIDKNDDINGSSNNRSEINQDLCAGTYLVTVEGFGHSSGDFRLAVFVNDIPSSGITGGEIETTVTAHCAGEDLPGITNKTQSTESIYPENINNEYQWEKQVGNASPTYFNEGPSLTNGTTGDMGSQTVKFRRRAIVCGVNGSWSNTITFTPKNQTHSPGAISYMGDTYIKQGDRITTIIDNETSHSGGPAPLVYSWEKSVDGGDWEVFPVATPNHFMTSSELGNLDSSTKIRRVSTNDCGDQKYSNEISITVLEPNGRIQGIVTGKDGAGRVDDVEVCAIRITEVSGGSLNEEFCDITENGAYDIQNIYYGQEADFAVVPRLAGHGFKPDTIYATGMNAYNREFDGDPMTFEDTTTFTLSGRITLADSRECGVPNVRFKIARGNDQMVLQPDKSDNDGYYSLSIPNIGDYKIEPILEDHTFSPNILTEITVNNDVENVNFSDITIATFSGSILACGDFYFGKVVLTITDSLNCSNHQVTTDDKGAFEISLPARNYNISVSDVVDSTLVSPAYTKLKVMEGLGKVHKIDLDVQDTTLNLVYHQPPVIEIMGLSANSCGDTVLMQGKEVPIVINVYEENTNGCPLDTGLLIIIDQISDREGMQIEIPISKGRAEYVMLPGQPNITPDAEDPSNSYKKTISITADDLSGGALAQTTIDPKVIVEGFRARESTFTTVTPEIPLLILRDPPGDGSHSFLETSKSTELAMSLSTLKGGSVTTWSEVKVGAQFEAGFIGFSTETEVWGTIGASATVGASNTSTEEVVMTLTNNQRFQTSDSDDPDIMGADGDLFYGAAMNLRYAKSDIIEYDPAICKATARVELAMQNKEFETQFLYTAFSIRNSIIPSLEDLRDLQTEDSQIRYYQTQVDIWEQMLQRNDELKEQAVDDPNFNPSNISWSGGTVFDYSTSQESSSSIILEFLTEIDGEIATELGLEVAGSGISGGVNINMRMELGESKTTTQTEGRTTGFVLHDDDALDRFETGIKIDPVYKTPVFVNNSAITSCPYEPGTSPIDGPELFIPEPNVSNVNIDAAAGYNFKLRNLSEDQKIRDYKLRVIPSSNPSGAVISIGNDEILFADMNYLEERDFFISVSRGPGTDPNVFTFEGIQFEFYPECDESQASIGTIRASFVSPCSDLTFSQPEPNWLLNQSNNDNLEIILRDYDKNALTQLVVQYANAGTNGWQVAQLIDPEDLDNNATIGTSINVSLGGLNDGNYDVRIKTVCDAGDTYTERRRGIIDREGPVVFGLPEPADDIYDFNAGDEISVEFEDVLDCTQVTDSDVTLIGLTNGNIITTQVSCVNNKILIIPTQALSTTDAYRVILDGITDVNHNNNESPIRWVFIGKDYVIDESCGPLAISNNNLNQDAISQSVYRATILETNGTIAPFTSINYKAEESILFDSGFEVVNGGELIAEIETCPK